MRSGEIAAKAIMFATVLAVALIIDCKPAARRLATKEAPQAPTDAVVLVTIDGTRWQEIFDGVDPALGEAAAIPRRTARQLLPNMRRLFFEEGTVIGDPRLAGGIEGTAPRHMSIPGYVEITTGAATDCADNACRPALGETIVDAVMAAPGEGEAAAVFGSWSEIRRATTAHPEKLFVQTGAAPSDAGRPLSGSERYLADRVTAADALEHLRRNHPRFLWVALGDTDEWAHAGDYRGYLDALTAADRFLGDLVTTLDRMGDRGARTAIVVTADHGRDPDFRDHGDPPSASVWLLARGPSIAAQGPTATAQRRRLRDVAPTLRALLGLPARTCATCGTPIAELLPAPLAQAGVTASR